MERGWSDRCVSCKFFNAPLHMCIKTESEHYNEFIDVPNSMTCLYWRYKY